MAAWPNEGPCLDSSHFALCTEKRSKDKSLSEKEREARGEPR